MMPEPGTAGRLRMLVLSDVHGHVQQDDCPAPSWFPINVRNNVSFRNPFVGLKKLLSEEPQLDAVIVPGDLGHQANVMAANAVWAEIERLRIELQIPLLLATAGNHDVDSRATYSYNSYNTLRCLVPAFPTTQMVEGDYWNKHFCVFNASNYRVLLLNSCGFHGMAMPIERNHGRVSDDTLDSLETYLNAADEKPINILLTHHHVAHDARLQEFDTELTIGSAKLLTTLSTAMPQGCLVIHGHRHHPNLHYAGGGNTAPTILSSGSLSAVLYPELATVARNQFHVVEFDPDAISRFGLVGTIRTWSWHNGSGWSAATEKEGLPHIAGFGLRASPQQVAARAAEVLPKVDYRWPRAIEESPELKFLIPTDLSSVLRLLRDNHGINHEMLATGVPSELRPF